MSTMKTTLCVITVTLLSAGCIDDDDQPPIVVEPPTSGGTGSGSGGGISEPPRLFEWQANIISNDVFRWQLTGMATALQTEGNTAFSASISIRNDLTGTARPWHVHYGTCSTGGGIVGSDAAYPRLSIDVSGAANASVTIRDVALDPAAQYHINVHESNAQFDTLIACGDLILQ